ncbi:diguanylate cyclase domain-containing protein [Shewanella sp.]|uniref:diguanylate cyclase domain-containing protein n=1 Tax=Shewanella sp. TaxID=50422 RepID=UPI0035674AE8
MKASTFSDNSGKFHSLFEAGTFPLVLLSLVYAVSGILSLKLALAPGYASPIFPPAGIAMAAAFLAGRRTWPFIFLGSLLLNLWIGLQDEQIIEVNGIVLATIIAMASLFQAILGSTILRKTLSLPTSLDNNHEVASFLILTPLFCITSASISVAGLFMLGVIDVKEVLNNWVNWWIGDTLGVIVLFPITMIFTAAPFGLWRSRISTVALPITAVFVFFIVIYIQLSKWEYSDTLSEFKQFSQQSVTQIQAKLETQETLLLQTAALFLQDNNNLVSRDEFSRFASRLLSRYPMIQALSYTPRVTDAQKDAFIASQQLELPQFTITERTPEGLITPAGVRDFYYPVTYIEPLAGNKEALGFDLASNSLRMDAIIKAKQTGELIASAPLQLVQEKQNQKGVLLFMAVNPTDPFSNVVTSVLRMGNFMTALLPHLRPHLYMRLIDIDAQSTLYDNFGPEQPAALFSESLNFGGRSYRFETAPTPLYNDMHRGWQSWGLLAIGILSTGLLSALLLLTTGYTAKIEAQVKDRTRKLSDSEFRWKFALEGSGDGVWDWDIPNGKVFFSRRWKEMLGYDQAEIKSNVDEWKTRLHPDDKAATLNALQANLDGITPIYTIEHRLRCRDGSWKWILDRGMVVSRDAQGQPLRVIGTQTDITERKLHEQLVQRLAHYDNLTGLPNRSLFDDRFRQHLAAAKRYQRSMAVLFIDLDNFKPVNDDLGHHWGDELLKQAASRMQSCVREADTLSRIGGDEFVIILPTINSAKDAIRVAEKIRCILNEPFQLDIHQISISSSIGLALYPDDGLDELELLKKADTAMYAAKAAGRNSIRQYRDDMPPRGF